MALLIEIVSDQTANGESHDDPEALVIQVSDVACGLHGAIAQSTHVRDDFVLLNLRTTEVVSGGR